MKKLNLKLAGVITFSLLSVSTFAQNWRVGGNTTLQMGFPGNQPILGTLAGNNQPLLFHANGTQRMRIFSNNTAFPGLSGALRIGTSNGVGGVLERPRLFVVGNTTDNSGGGFTIAEFRSFSNCCADAGIKIRGSRAVATTTNTGNRCATQKFPAFYLRKHIFSRFS